MTQDKAAAPPQQAAPEWVMVPRTVLARAWHALEWAGTICDRVPTRLHTAGEPGWQQDLGRLVNKQDDGRHGYAVIRDAAAELLPLLSAAPAQAAPVDPPHYQTSRGRTFLFGGWESGESPVELFDKGEYLKCLHAVCLPLSRSDHATRQMALEDDGVLHELVHLASGIDICRHNSMQALREEIQKLSHELKGARMSNEREQSAAKHPSLLAMEGDRGSGSAPAPAQAPAQPFTEDDPLVGQTPSVLRAMVRFWQRQCEVLRSAAPPQAAAQAPAVTAKPIVWEQDNANQWSESDYGFYITLDTDEDRDADNPYFAAWGEGDEDRFDSLEAAQGWCQDKINSYFREYAVVAAAPAQAAQPVDACIDWIRNNYQDHPNIDSLCNAMRSALCPQMSTDGGKDIPL